MSGVITSHLEIHRESKDILKKLVADLGETAHIAILEGKEITYVHKIECRNPVRLLSSIGKKNPVSCTSAGKVLLAFQSNDMINSLIEAGLPRMGPNSVTDPDQLKAQLIQIKEQGYSICINEMHEDVVSIAASVRDYTGEVVAAVSVVGTSERIHHQKINRFVETIIEAANEVSIRLGYIPLLLKRRCINVRYPSINEHHYSSLRNALRLLNLFSVDEPELQLQDIATKLEIGQSTAFRLVHTLIVEGFVMRDPSANLIVLQHLF